MINAIKKLFESKKEKDDAFVKNSKHFCMMPWVHFHITQLGTVTPCCKTNWEESGSFGNINIQSVEEIWNGQAIRQFRSNLLHDRKDKRCQRCYQDEEVGLYSLRQVTNDNYLNKIERLTATQKDGYLPKPYQPLYWDIRFSNLCNFKCRICGHWASSKWFSDAKALNQEVSNQALTYSYHDFSDFMKELEKYVPDMEEIYFAGGEPLIMDEHLVILKLLQKYRKYEVKLRYNTNFSLLYHKGTYVPSLWDKFEHVLLCASLDDENGRGELQRKGQNWEQTIINRQTLAEKHPDIDFMLTPTISVFNAFNLPQLHKNWVDLKLIDVADCWPNTLDRPDYYNVKIFPLSLKEELIAQYKDYINWIKGCPTKKPQQKEMLIKRIQHCLNYMLTDDWSDLIPVFREKTLALDVLRNESTADAIPQLKDLLK